MSTPRLSYEESIQRLRDLGAILPHEQLQLPERLPEPGDPAPLGFSFFRTFVGDNADLSNLTIPRTFFGRSDIRDCSFRNTDLSESNLRWNDFTNVDFTDAILTNADLRASIYIDVVFHRTDLRNADLRRSTFENCIFLAAKLDGAKVFVDDAHTLDLTVEQIAVVTWCHDDGPEPAGG